MQDLRFALRQLLKNPSFTAVAVLTLALGIGANTALSSVVNSVLLRPLPYPDAGRLVRIASVNSNLGLADSRTSALNVLDWQRQSTLFEGIGAFQEWDGILTFNGKSTSSRINWVTPNLMPMLGLQPELGTLLPVDNTPGYGVVLPHGLWMREFGGDASMIGKTLVESGMESLVFGVLRPDTAPAPAQGLPATDQAFVRLPLERLDYPRDWHLLNVIGRLKPGVSVAQAQAELDGITRDLERLYPETNRGWGAKATDLKSWMLQPVRNQLLMVYAATGIILLMACLNVSNLLLIRGEGRRKELAIRCALGSNRWQLARQSLAETLLLALAGGAAGFLLAAGGGQALLRCAPNSLGLQQASVMDGTVLAAMLVVTLLAGLLFGLFPALRASRANLNRALVETGRSTSPGRTSQRWLGGLAAGQIAISTVLLIATGLAVASFRKLTQVHPGFVKENTLCFRVAQFNDQSSFRGVLDALAVLPGVQSAGCSHMELLNDVFSNPIRISVEGGMDVSSPATPTVNYWLATKDYFSAAGIPLLAGRTFEAGDDEKAPVVVINEALANQFFPNQDPIGKLIDIPSAKAEVAREQFRIIGVVGSIRQHGPREAAVPVLFRHYTRHDQGFATGSLGMVLRTKGNPIALLPAARAAIQQVNPELVVTRVSTGETIVDGKLVGPRFATLLMFAFAALGLLLAAVGLYGVLTYLVAQRTQEIGIRIALGAQRWTVLRMVLREGMALVAVGMAAGLAGALAVTQLLRNLLFGVTATDPFTFITVPLMFLAVALLACWLPARRAARVDPMEALRNEGEL